MQRAIYFSQMILFFLIGAVVTALVLTAGGYLAIVTIYSQRTYPGVRIVDQDLSGFSGEQIKKMLAGQGYDANGLEIILATDQATVSATAAEIGLKVDGDLLAKRAMSVGRQTNNPYYNLLQIWAAFEGNINLPLEVKLDRVALNRKLDSVSATVEKKPVDAVFEVKAGAGPDGKGRVVAFSPSENGVAIDREKIAQTIINQTKNYWILGQRGSLPSVISVPIYTKVVLPTISSSNADSLGIKDLLGEGTSYFYDSIPGRIYNIRLGTSKVSGSLVAPGEIFSFDQSIGTVSAVFGFAKAYSIIKGKTVLDDGGGVCQVSTTLYRAVLNSGLPVVARTAHTYRVGFYEEGGFLPGLDATVYPPDPDFRFKNDTGNWLLIQANFDADKAKLTFDIFGTDDGRKTNILGPYFISTSPPPDPVTEDDPTLPVGQTKQVDTAHAGARVYFKRIVTRENEVLINETVYSDYVPWPARFLRGTKT